MELGELDQCAKAAQPCTGEVKWLTGFDLNNLSSGASKHFDKIGADTIQRVGAEYAQKRRAARRYRLRWPSTPLTQGRDRTRKDGGVSIGNPS